MTKRVASVRDASDNPAQAPLSLGLVIGVAGVFLLVSSEIVVAATAAVWAAAGLLHLGHAATWTLAAIAAMIVLYAMAQVLRLAIASERDINNQ